MSFFCTTTATNVVDAIKILNTNHPLHIKTKDIRQGILFFNLKFERGITLNVILTKFYTKHSIFPYVNL